MKTALITGASGGIGYSIAKKLASLGYSLALIYNKNEEQIRKLEKEIASNSNHMILKCDLTETKQVEEMITKVMARYKKIDLLINNAGISLSKQIQDITELDYQNIFDTNVKSTIFTTKYVSKYMISQKSGKIINISSIWGNVGASMESLYSASKGAVNAFTMAISKELGPSNIIVNAISPGLINTDMNKHLTDMEKEDFLTSTSLGRIGTPEDIANTIAFLASDDSNYITGQIFNINGGYIS